MPDAVHRKRRSAQYSHIEITLVKTRQTRALDSGLVGSVKFGGRNASLLTYMPAIQNNLLSGSDRRTSTNRSSRGGANTGLDKIWKIHGFPSTNMSYIGHARAPVILRLHSFCSPMFALLIPSLSFSARRQPFFVVSFS